ncbi:hypothetical protein C8R47DRAFT_1193136 [Mycena vitilis]|nr:hypothetical protein C8R47DRAFT_1193136 [Mycena vitilis]
MKRTEAASRPWYSMAFIPAPTSSLTESATATLHPVVIRPPNTQTSNRTKAVVGGVVGGLCVIGIVLALVLMLSYRKRRASQPRVDDDVVPESQVEILRYGSEPSQPRSLTPPAHEKTLVDRQQQIRQGGVADDTGEAPPEYDQ